MVQLIGIWAILVTVIYISSFISPNAASFEPFGRIIYMVVLCSSIIALVLGLMRSENNRGK